ncbi:hypothetical protein ACFLIM_40695 [Nonomuraea sp. M3C6]|uniref:Uncharacterized protein n=1 Tax=Nonomuraea marmarensis TaxID=3351344 RepID=A0ABW7ATK1_9ACTN
MEEEMRYRRPIVLAALPLALAGFMSSAHADAGNAARTETKVSKAVARGADIATQCGFGVGRTFKDYYHIYGSGRLTRCRGGFIKITVRLQRSRWYGWQTLATGSRTDNGLVSVKYRCKGNGTHTYRTQVAGLTWSGQTQFKYSNQFRTSC